MEGNRRRLRSSVPKRADDDGPKKSKVMNITSNAANIDEKYSSTSNDSVSVSRSQTETETTDGGENNLQKRRHTSRKRENIHIKDTEKENVELLKENSDASCPSRSKGKLKPNSDRNNNECSDSNMCPSKSKAFSKKAKSSTISSTPCPTPASSLSKKQSEIDSNQSQVWNQLSQSQFGAVNRIKSQNVYHHYVNSNLGKSVHHLLEPMSSIIAKQLSDYETVHSENPFQCRITSIEWHPRKRNFLGVGSKHGDMAFYKVKYEDNSGLEEIQKFPGIGPGGNIPSMKFHPTHDNLVYTSSLCGKVSCYDIEGQMNDVLLDTMSWDFWYSSLDVHKTDLVVAAGRNKGGAALLDMDGKCIWDKRLHRKKISHIEFSPRDPHTLCTASLDHSVKLWDLRKVVEKMPVATLVHQRGLNSAYFSLTDGCRLLTTDQSEEIRIYSSLCWELEKTITHPHRFFQHLTPIKAYWHPLQDIVICGRYPNVATLPQFNFLRCIDMFDASTGARLGEICDPYYKGITSLVKMNNEGTKLVSAMGYTLNLWNCGDRKLIDAFSKYSMREALQEARDKAAKSSPSSKAPKKTTDGKSQTTMKSPKANSARLKKKGDKDCARKKDPRSKSDHDYE